MLIAFVIIAVAELILILWLRVKQEKLRVLLDVANCRLTLVYREKDLMSQAKTKLEDQMWNLKHRLEEAEEENVMWRDNPPKGRMAL